MARIAYFRVSTGDQSIAMQREALGGQFDKQFADEGVSGAIPAASRPGFQDLLRYAREGDTVCVYAVDRLGRDAIDVQTTVRNFLSIGVAVHVHGLGVISSGAGELILAVLAQVADMERKRIVERTQHGRAIAKASLAETGRTHRGKSSLGRPPKLDADEVKAWRALHGASISATAAHFQLSTATIKRYLAA